MSYTAINGGATKIRPHTDRMTHATLDTNTGQFGIHNLRRTNIVRLSLPMDNAAHRTSDFGVVCILKMTDTTS